MFATFVLNPIIRQCWMVVNNTGLAKKSLVANAISQAVLIVLRGLSLKVTMMLIV
tara:strand:- start:329 stop:493 length:165 start_codon:yes stop_codon:yes gene_type:complete